MCIVDDNSGAFVMIIMIKCILTNTTDVFFKNPVHHDISIKFLMFCCGACPISWLSQEEIRSE